MTHIAVAILLCVPGAAVAITQAAQPPVPRGAILEIRSYNLKPGTREAFHRLFVEESLPMLRRWKVDVVAYGPSAHDAESYFLMRAFPSLEERQRSEEAFYASEEWRSGPRERVLAPIVSYTTVVVHTDVAAIAALRKLTEGR